MRFRPLFLLSISLLALLSGIEHGAAQAPDAPAAETPADKLKALVHEAQVLQQRKRFLDALTKLEEAEKIDPKRAEIYNVRGAVYLSQQMRDFDRARIEFKKALEIEPEAMAAMFNLAEADYVQGHFADGEKGFANLLVKFPKLLTPVRHLVMFKQIICMIKQDKVEDAQKLMDANFTFMDDSPAYYFSKAAMALHKKDEKTGNTWLGKAQIIFKKSDVGAYLDTLMEGHYLDGVVGKAEESK